MTFLAPAYLLLAAAAAVALVIAHFITRHRPPRTPFPTARFVPESSAPITARSYRLSDRGLLALRLLIPLMAGAALAAPILASDRRPVARVIMADLSRAAADAAEVRDSVRALYRSGDALIAFDSAGRRIDGRSDEEQVAQLRSSFARGSLSTALAAGYRAAASLRGRADSVELVLVSPMVREELDAATMEVRSLHAGRIRLVQVAISEPPGPMTSFDFRGTADDPLAAALVLAGATGSSSSGESGYAARLVRGALTTDDSSWARVPQRVLVHWPVEATHMLARSSVDTVGALVAEGTAVVAPFAREAAAVPGQRVVARWGDGVAAATERSADGDAGSCLRHVAIPVPSVGDIVLRPAFVGFVRQLLAPCGGARDLAPLDTALLTELAGTGPLLATASLGDERRRSPLTPWLLGLALLAAVAELAVRRRST